MFIDSNALSDGPRVSPWVIRKSGWRARYSWKLLTKVSSNDVYKYMLLTSCPLLLISMTYFATVAAGLNDSSREWMIVPILVLLPVVLFQLWRTVIHSRINLQPRKYIAQPGDYSYDKLFRHMAIVATDEELRTIPDLRRRIDRYFSVTQMADKTIRRSRLEHHDEKALVDYIALSVRQDIVEIVSKVRHERSMSV